MIYQIPACQVLTETLLTIRSSCITQATVKELEALRSKYGSLLTTAKSHEEMAGRAAREGQLRAEEVREKLGLGR